MVHSHNEINTHNHLKKSENFLIAHFKKSLRSIAKEEKQNAEQHMWYVGLCLKVEERKNTDMYIFALQASKLSLAGYTESNK